MSVHYDCLVAVQQTIRDLDLAGVADESVVVLKLPLLRALAARSVSLPAVLITPGQTKAAAGGDNVQDDTDLGCRVLIVVADNQERTGQANLETMSGWVERVRRAFHNKRLSGVSSVYTCEVIPGDTVDPTAWEFNYLASGMTVVCRSREKRA